MGLFLALTAVRDADGTATTDAVTSWFDEQYVACSSTTTLDGVHSSDLVEICAPVNGWTVVVWPTYFRFLADGAASYVSAHVGTVASSVDVYDSDCWSHYVHDRGSQVDQYCSDPRYQMSSADTLLRAFRRYRGNPGVVAQHLGGSTRDVARHFRRGRAPWTLNDWAFSGLWQHFGIEYPDPDHPRLARFVLPDRWDDTVDRLIQQRRTATDEL